VTRWLQSPSSHQVQTTISPKRSRPETNFDLVPGLHSQAWHDQVHLRNHGQGSCQRIWPQIHKDLREGLDHLIDVTQQSLSFTHLPEECLHDKTVAETEDHQNKGNIPALALSPMAISISFSKFAPSSRSLSDKNTHTLLFANADAFKAWSDSILNLTNNPDGKSLNQVHGLTPAQFAPYIPRMANNKTSGIT
jgi:hypothetical protein